MIVGYFLAFLFETNSAMIVFTALTIMLFTASWISLGSIADQRPGMYKRATTAMAFGSGTALLVITQGVLMIEPWYAPAYLIPLGGMILANAMNCISLAAERMSSEIQHGQSYLEARAAALKASMLPVINSLFAVGIVTLPGLMTGQILSGVSPLIAARYQIVIMCMLFASAGLSSITFLCLSRHQYKLPSKT